MKEIRGKWEIVVYSTRMFALKREIDDVDNRKNERKCDNSHHKRPGEIYSSYRVPHPGHRIR